MDENLTRIEGLFLGFVTLLPFFVCRGSCASIHVFIIACIYCEGDGLDGSGNVAVDTMIDFATVLSRGTR